MVRWIADVYILTDNTRQTDRYRTTSLLRLPKNDASSLHLYKAVDYRTDPENGRIWCHRINDGCSEY